MRREGDVIKIEELRHKRAQISRKGANVYLLPLTILLKIIFFCDFKNLTCKIVRRSIEYFQHICERLLEGKICTNPNKIGIGYGSSGESDDDGPVVRFKKSKSCKNHSELFLEYTSLDHIQRALICAPITPNMPNMVFGAHIWASQIWSSGVSLKRSCKMHLIHVDLALKGPPSQKL